MTIKNSIKKPVDKLKCLNCKSDKNKEKDFYNSKSKLYSELGKAPICKTCLKSMINYDDINSVYSVLQQLDVMFDIEYWNKAVESKSDTFGRYISMTSTLHQFTGTSWKDSVFEKKVELQNNQNTSSTQSSSFTVTDDLIDKWGENYTSEEYRSFERKYHNLKNNYQEKTAMHTEALLTYIRYRVKEELSTAKGDVKEAKDWGALAQKAAQDAKINPSQLSKSDLSDGLDTFGQLVRSVEQAVDIIPILPQFRERPQDKVDFTLFCYVNYVRDLKGLPHATYEEIHAFYDQRKKDYESSTGGLDGEL